MSKIQNHGLMVNPRTIPANRSRMSSSMVAIFPRLAPRIRSAALPASQGYDHRREGIQGLKSNRRARFGSWGSAGVGQAPFTYFRKRARVLDPGLPCSPERVQPHRVVLDPCAPSLPVPGEVVGPVSKV